MKLLSTTHTCCVHKDIRLFFGVCEEGLGRETESLLLRGSWWGVWEGAVGGGGSTECRVTWGRALSLPWKSVSAVQ